MAILHRKNANKADPHDPEKGGDPNQPKEDAPDYENGDEYEILLRYVENESKKAARSSDDDDEDKNEAKFVRPWYAPWKKVKKESTHERKVPDEWLKTDMKQGLDEGEISKRREAFGYNELTAAKENQFLKVVGYFRGPILYCMEMAVILAAGLRDWIDFGVIIAILLLNAGVGWYQEKQAGDIVEQLKAGIALKATVIRGGAEHEIEARELVPGDIIVLEEGHTIPADANILADYKDKDGSKGRAILEKVEAAKKKKASGQQKKGDDDDDDDDMDKGPSVCSVDQSAITGESLAVDKFIGDSAPYTCGIKRGKCYAVVSCSAKQSFVGRTAALVQGSNQKGHFQIVLDGIGLTLLIMVFVFIFAAWIGGFFRGTGIATPRDNNLLLYALIFFIIGVPVGLPCVTTTTMAVGAAYLARRKAIVQKLTAIESLAGVDVLCSDKTGTLTANKLSLNEPYLAEGVTAEWFMTVAVLASSHNVKSLDPIDKVTVLALKDYPKAQEELQSGWHTSKFSPFDPVSKRIEAQVEKNGKKYTCAKGAPNSILKLRKFDQATVTKYRATAQEFAKRGFRSLGVAVKEDGKDWDLLGIMSMQDPPRGDTKQTIGEAIDLGISIKMLTGDAVAIAKETCRALGLGQNIFDSQQLIGGGMAGSDIRDFVEHADGFAEVFPEHKYQVVDMLQQRGHLTAMTGDGVNDAPSLKRADCGIAVEGASDAARSAADVVFLDEGLSTIITAIKVARQIFHRMKAYMIYRIALCIHLELYLLLDILILDEVIRADLIVFLAIFADVATIAIAYDHAPYARKPVEWQLPKLWVNSTVMGLLLAGGTWILRGTMFLNDGGIVENFGNLQEIIFLEVALTESWVIFITRTSQGSDDGGFVWPSWQLIGAVFGVDILASLFCIFGWVSGGPQIAKDTHGGQWTSIVTVVRVWLFSFGVVIVVAFVYYIMTRIKWLDSLGRNDPAAHKDAKLENFLTEVQRLTLTHENPDNGATEVFKFGTGQTPAQGGGQSTQQHAAGQKEKEAKRVEEGNNPTDTEKGETPKNTPEEGSKAGKEGGTHPRGEQLEKEDEDRTVAPTPREEGSVAGHTDDDHSSDATKRDSGEQERERAQAARTISRVSPPRYPGNEASGSTATGSTPVATRGTTANIGLGPVVGPQ